MTVTLNKIEKAASLAGLECCTLSPQGLAIPDGLAFEEWEQIGQSLRQINGGVLWWIGDWLNYGEQRYGEKYSQALEATDYEYQTLRDAAWVSKEIGLSRRRDNLSWSHHREVAPLPVDEQSRWLNTAEAEGWSSRDLRREVKSEGIRARLEDVAAREAKEAQGVYDVLVIDPPWPMEKIERDVRPNQVAFDYPTMTEEELEAMDVPAAEAAHVWVWTTQKFLPMAMRLLGVWGLNYVCTFVWRKPGGFQPIGLPQYNCEFALYARKGSPAFVDTKAFDTCFDAPRGKHSEKPEEFYEVLRRVTAGRRIDIFNRRPIEGFDSWGKEAANG